MIEALEIEAPHDISEQRAIAHVLGSLDDKIELNRRMNETLEGIARALFKSWFVDFDPVRAKAEGRDPGLPKPIADLFPDSFEDSELGEIPKGWEVKALDEVACFLNGLALQKYPPTANGWLPVIKIAQLRAKSMSGADRASSELDTDYVVKDGDILFSWSGSLECALWAGGPGALNQHLFKVSSSNYELLGYRETGLSLAEELGIGARTILVTSRFEEKGVLADSMRLKARLCMKINRVAGLIHVVRNQRVMLDADLAALYGVETGNLNKAVSRNLSRFPAGFMFQLSSRELENLRCQIGISRWGGRRYAPRVFAEQGVAMLSSVLNSSGRFRSTSRS